MPLLLDKPPVLMTLQFGTPIVLADSETDGLTMPYLPRGRRAWEYALFRWNPNRTGMWLEGFIDLRDLPWNIDDPDLDRTGLDIGRFFERHPQVNPDAKGQVYREADMAALIFELFQDDEEKPWLWGINPSFEQDQFGDLLRRHNLIESEPPWYHSPQCARTFLAGALRASPPWDSRRLSALAGIDPSGFDLHTARGDVELALALLEAALRPAWKRRVARGKLALRRALTRL